MIFLLTLCISANHQHRLIKTSGNEDNYFGYHEKRRITKYNFIFKQDMHFLGYSKYYRPKFKLITKYSIHSEISGIPNIQYTISWNTIQTLNHSIKSQIKLNLNVDYWNIHTKLSNEIKYLRAHVYRATSINTLGFD